MRYSPPPEDHRTVYFSTVEGTIELLPTGYLKLDRWGDLCQWYVGEMETAAKTKKIIGQWHRVRR